MRDMLGRGGAVSVEEARGIITRTFSDRHTLTERLPIAQARDRILAQGISSPEDMPGFSRSTVDGYALRAADTFGASETSPGYLTIAFEIPMGTRPQQVLQSGECAKIATGGMLPEGADAVLMFEHATAVDRTILEAQRSLAPGENVIQRGEDVTAGTPLMQTGRRLRPQDLAALASLGITHVDVYRPATVSIISTGDEIVPPEAAVTPGVIRDSNSYLLAALCEDCSALPVKRGILPDRFEVIRAEVERSCRETDVVLITGGSSVGTRDMAQRVIEDLGEVLFHGVYLKPGKPLLVGNVAGTAVFGLPGHPRAVHVCFEMFVRPMLRFISGLGDDFIEGERSRVTARLARAVSSSIGRQENVAVELELMETGLVAHPVLGKSGLLVHTIKAHGSFDIEAGSTGVEEGELIQVRLC